MEEIIKAWLRGAKNYTQGVAIYKQFGQDLDLLQFFLKGITPFRQQRLQEALSALSSGQVPERSAGQDDPDLPAEPAAATKDTPLLQELHRKKVVLSREKDELRGLLEGFETDKERGEAAFRILEIRQIITGIWDMEQHYKQHGRLPENSDHLITDLQNLKHHRSRINGNLRRVRAQLKKTPNDPTKKALLSKWEAEYKQVKQSIKQQQEKE